MTWVHFNVFSHSYNFTGAMCCFSEQTHGNQHFWQSRSAWKRILTSMELVEWQLLAVQAAGCRLTTSLLFTKQLNSFTGDQADLHCHLAQSWNSGWAITHWGTAALSFLSPRSSQAASRVLIDSISLLIPYWSAHWALGRNNIFIFCTLGCAAIGLWSLLSSSGFL